MTKKEQFDNSFYNADLTMRKALVIVPHQDDEINVAGHTILNLLHMGAEIYVVYTTNGDYELDPEVRMKEAQNALKILGIPPKNIILLGYGDTSFSYPQHLFHARVNTVKSPSGHLETYGVGNHVDYSYQKRGVHSPYHSRNYARDLKSVILDMKADLIFCVDNDEHPDHRMLAIVFDTVMGEILSRPGNKYKPMILKKFAYCLAYFSKPDFFADNIRSTQRPIVNTKKYHYDFIGTSMYLWKDRVRLPAAKSATSILLRRNKLGKALQEYTSQYGLSHADRIINGDDIYWQRRTDSLSYAASISVSSGRAEYLNDFCLFNTKEIMEKEMIPSDYLWKPDENDNNKTVRFQWEHGQEISLIRIYGNINNDSNIEKLRISFNTGFTMEAGPLLQNGCPLDIEILKQSKVTSCVIQILSAQGCNYGIAECEFYSNIHPETIFPCFIKTLIHDDFVYTYRISNRENKLPLSFYQYGSCKEIQSVVTKGRSNIRNGILYINGNDSIIEVTTFIKNNKNVYDKVLIKRCNAFQIQHIRGLQRLEKFFIFIQNKRSKSYRFYMYLKEKGILYTIKKLKINISL